MSRENSEQFVVSNEGEFDIGLLTEFTGLAETHHQGVSHSLKMIDCLHFLPFSKLKELRLISTGLSSVERPSTI
jgi:hypothetical protein